MKTLLLTYIVFILSINAVAAAGVGPETAGQGSGPATLNTRQDVADVNGTVGNDIILPLDANPTTGYIWQLGEPLDEKIVTLGGHRYERPETDRVGAGGRDIWIFKAIGPGQTLVFLDCVRPWEKGVPPIKRKIFKIRILP